MFRLISVSYLVAAIMLLYPQCVSAASQQGLNRSKLTDPEKITAPFEQGEMFARVVVNLKQPEEILAKTNWRSQKSLSILREEIRRHQKQVFSTLTQNDFLLRHRFENITSFSGEVSLAGLQKLTNDPRVKSIEPTFLLEPHLQQGINLMNAAATRNTNSGQGVSIAICDTGIDYTHPALGAGGFPNSKVIGGYDTGDNDSNPIPEGQAHGTCCAGIAAGNNTNVGDYIGGVANGAKLYALKITSGSSGSAYNSDIAAAWDWCVTHQYDDIANPIMVISTSFGGGRYFNSCDGVSSILTNAANNAVAAGITVLASSGNDGYCDAISSPACISNIISVGAVYDAAFGTYYPCLTAESCATKTYSPSSGCPDNYYATDITAADKVTSYSNTASFLDMLAPSNRAYTTDIANSAGYSTGDYYTSFGGTSAACPYAAGAVAILQSAAKAIIGDYLTPDEIRNLLATTGDEIADEKIPDIIKPRINVGNAMGIFNESPPVANDLNEVTMLDTPLSITLNASDDGLPFPPGVLSYIITSLPNHGILTDPNALVDPNDPNSVIVSVPYMLSGDEVVYTPRPGCDRSAVFTYIANDSGAAPDGGDSNEATVAVQVVDYNLIYSANMDSDPGWTYEGDWEWGVPQGLGGADHGNPDPTSGHTGANVVGYNLSGDYKKRMRSTLWTTTPAFDCSSQANVTLSFYRWLNVQGPDYDHAYIQASNDGSNWTTIWENTTEVTDASWTLQTFDISLIADNQATVYVRWGMGTTDGFFQYSGWNIDDVTVTGAVPSTGILAGDFEPDCDVDVNDLTLLISYWLADCGDCGGVDLIVDGIVDLADFQALANNWLAGL